MRREFSRTTKALAFQRANGKCEGTRPDGSPCGARLAATKVEYDHDNPDGLTGEPTLENCKCLCLQCHKDKTKRDVSNIAQAKRRQARHIGAHHSANPLPCGKTSKWKKKMTGEVVLR